MDTGEEMQTLKDSFMNNRMPTEWQSMNRDTINYAGLLFRVLYIIFSGLSQDFVLIKQCFICSIHKIALEQG